MSQNHKNLLLNAASLMSEDAENAEYDRAIVELVCDTVGISSDDRDVVMKILRALK